MSMTPADRAKEYFGSGYNCAQSVLRAVLEGKNLTFPQATYLMAAFGGGIAGQGETCGAVTGAIAAIGMVLSQIEPNVSEHKKRSNEVAQRFLAMFREEFRCTHCSCLVGANMSNPEERKRASDTGRIRKTCPGLVEKAASIVMGLT